LAAFGVAGGSTGLDIRRPESVWNKLSFGRFAQSASKAL
jgi:hypothetical protein